MPYKLFGFYSQTIKGKFMFLVFLIIPLTCWRMLMRDSNTNISSLLVDSTSYSHPQQCTSFVPRVTGDLKIE